jgi:hypothetical protein
VFVVQVGNQQDRHHPFGHAIELPDAASEIAETFPANAGMNIGNTGLEQQALGDRLAEYVFGRDCEPHH